MLWVMDMPLGLIGSSHSALGCDGSSISEHGRAFSDMDCRRDFQQLWCLFGLHLDPPMKLLLEALHCLFDHQGYQWILWSSGSLIVSVVNCLISFNNSPCFSCKHPSPESGSILPSLGIQSKYTMPSMSADIMVLENDIWVGVRQYTWVWWDDVKLMMWYRVDWLGGCGAVIVKFLYFWQNCTLTLA